MTKDERIAAMIAASGGKLTDADKTWLTGVPEGQLAGIEAANKAEAAPVVVAPVAAAAAPAPVVEKETQEQFLARNPELKSLVDRQKAQDTARRTYLVGKLKTAQTEYSEAQLNEMRIDDLERTARLLKVGGPVDTSVDFSGLAVPRDASQNDEAAPAPPDMNAAIRTARGIK